MDIFQAICIFFSKEDFNATDLVYELKEINKLLSEEDKKRKEYEIIHKCLFCQDLEFNSYAPVTLNEKLSNKYSKCAMMFGHKKDFKQQEETFTVDKTFFENFSDLKYFG